MGDICFLMVIDERARENYFQTLKSRKFGDSAIKERMLHNQMSEYNIECHSDYWIK